MKGIYSALLVSFDKDGNINEKGLRQIIRHNIDVCKVDGLYVGGSTGENFMLSTDEKKRIFEIAKDEAKDQIKLIAQVGSVNLKEAVELAKFATDLGYDSLSAVTPFYYKFDFAEIKHYYETIINSVDNKMIIYSIPFLTGVNMSLDQFAELFENEKIIGVKFTAADFYLLERMRKRFPDKLIFAGFDEMMLPATVLGVDGAIGSTFNVNGLRARQIFELAQEGKIAQALEIQHVTNDLITDILGNGLYQTIKAILEEEGVEAGFCRQPMKEATEEMRAKAKEMHKKYFQNEEALLKL
ncbi:N-acetylneuraminate lyase [Clostridium sp. CCUG 7971]|uniref:N-acetylneuraminate lyase n=1 Tax=Clostridium sp. CCUG 7971 TaxID=2811414 RepID=UPI001ABBAD28|nr:N-acetylneuraminate lyase [Clostridium sp. CCUG 7971]MBO3445882.1 N-acetylneuraminate lyase [Clostridium sp. CCUG 7971]